MSAVAAHVFAQPTGPITPPPGADGAPLHIENAPFAERPGAAATYKEYSAAYRDLIVSQRRHDMSNTLVVGSALFRNVSHDDLAEFLQRAGFIGGEKPAHMVLIENNARFAADACEALSAFDTLHFHVRSDDYQAYIAGYEGEQYSTAIFVQVSMVHSAWFADCDNMDHLKRVAANFVFCHDMQPSESDRGTVVPEMNFNVYVAQKQKEATTGPQTPSNPPVRESSTLFLERLDSGLAPMKCSKKRQLFDITKHLGFIVNFNASEESVRAQLAWLDEYLAKLRAMPDLLPEYLTHFALYPAVFSSV